MDSYWNKVYPEPVRPSKPESQQQRISAFKKRSKSAMFGKPLYYRNPKPMEGGRVSPK